MPTELTCVFCDGVDQVEEIELGPNFELLIRAFKKIRDTVASEDLRPFGICANCLAGLENGPDMLASRKDLGLRIELRSPDSIDQTRLPFGGLCEHCRALPQDERTALGALGLKNIHLLGLAHRAHTEQGLSPKDARAYAERIFPTDPEELAKFLMDPPWTRAERKI